MTQLSSAVLSDVTSYLTGDAIGINSITYDNLSGISSITTVDPHGLLIGNAVVIGGAGNSLIDGHWSIDTVYNLSLIHI